MPGSSAPSKSGHTAGSPQNHSAGGGEGGGSGDGMHWQSDSSSHHCVTPLSSSSAGVKETEV